MRFRYEATAIMGEARFADETEEPVRLSMSDAENGDNRTSRLRASFEALGKLRSSRSTGDWLEIAMTLKGDAIRLRSSQLARHSSILLALSDALTFTEPSDSGLDFQASTLDRSLALLSEPFVSESAEEALLTDLLSHGWNLAPSAGTDPLTSE